MDQMLGRQSGKAMMDVVTYPAWRYILTTYLKTSCDQIMLPEWQDRQIKAVRDAGVEIEVENLNSSHSPFLSLPEEIVAAVVRVSGRSVTVSVSERST